MQSLVVIYDTAKAFSDMQILHFSVCHPGSGRNTPGKMNTATAFEAFEKASYEGA